MKKQTQLAKKRLANDITGVQMAEALGIGISHYYYIESGERPATPELAEQIAQKLNAQVSELFDPKQYRAREEDKK